MPIPVTKTGFIIVLFIVLSFLTYGLSRAAEPEQDWKLRALKAEADIEQYKVRLIESKENVQTLQSYINAFIQSRRKQNTGASSKIYNDYLKELKKGEEAAKKIEDLKEKVKPLDKKE